MDDNSQATPAIEPLILEQMAEAVIYADPRGIIRGWNRAAERLFGHTAEQALGQSLDLIIPDSLRNAHWRGFDAAVKNRATHLAGRPTLTRAVHRSGGRRYVEMSFALVLDPAGAVLGAVAVARDATDRVGNDKADPPA